MPRASPPPLPWLDPGQAFPPVATAWGPGDPAPGLLAAGGALDVPTLCQAYQHGIFPWFSEGQPILWWSTDPRMVLAPADFRLHRSLAKTLTKFRRTPGCEVRFDTAFGQVIRACAQRPPKQDRPAHADGASAAGPGVDAARTARQAEEAEEAEESTGGTWIVPAMVAAYEALHRAGFAHSVETWINGELVGGLYCVALGRAVFGESMFSRRTDASKIALAALVAFCRAQGVAMIDCQQNTSHLATLGGREISRSRFTRHVAEVYAQPALPWRFENVYWDQIFPGMA